MTREETIALWEECEQARSDARAQGKSKNEAHAFASEVWSNWARPLVGRRKQMEMDGSWSAWPSAGGRLVGQNRVTIEFLASAEVVFSSSENPFTFSNDAIFTGWIFPGRAEFNSAVFEAAVTFRGVVFADVADFREAQFKSSAEFQNAALIAEGNFDGATFWRGSFQEARFVGKVSFADATFKNDADFSLVRFEAPAEFGKARFKWAADFSGVAFSHDASFYDAVFERTVWFRQASFSGYTTFAGCEFWAAAIFQAMKADRAFTLEKTKFRREIPDFIQAHFSEAPKLDSASFFAVFDRARKLRGKATGDPAPNEPNKLDTLASANNDIDATLAARFRALKRIAILGHDTERELEFNANEIRSRRYVEDHPLGPNAARFWLGWSYGQVSDFGRSAVKPILWWLGLNLIFAIFYFSPWSGRDASQGFNCVPVQSPISSGPVSLSTNPVWEALQLSFRNGALIFGGSDTTMDWPTLGCLYGTSEDHPDIRRIPRRAAVAVLLQRILSATLIFLFLMAVRNMLKID